MEEPIILFEDKQILVLRKPTGWLSQPDGTQRPDIYNWGRSYLKTRWEKPGEAYLGICHRLDRQVAGLLVLGKTSKASRRLDQQFLERTTQKMYLSLSEGTPPAPCGTLDYPMVRRERKTRKAEDGESSKRAALNYKLIETGTVKGKKASLMEIQLITGMRHQIRAQLSELGLPIIGDTLYGGSPPPEDSELSIGLFANALSFDHPVTHERLTFESEPWSQWPWKLWKRGN
ncbi:MAG: RluA family pseudouridine synthase [Deltaproteobacteria bacterium]|jgi:23S rRNA pseudouridine1911/1915/1917 synthase|nr:RluA family pseudouridine synthase [Deltaproteobacteria bacterium]